MTGTLIWPNEIAILEAMDTAFCEALAGEIAAWRERAERERG